MCEYESVLIRAFKSELILVRMSECESALVRMCAHLGDWDTLIACLRYSTTSVLPLSSAIRKGVHHPLLMVRHSRSHAQITGENIEYACYGLRVVMRIAYNNDHGYQTHPLKPTHTLHPRAPHTHTSIYCTYIRTPRHTTHSTHIQHIHTHAHILWTHISSRLTHPHFHKHTHSHTSPSSIYTLTLK